VLAFRVLEHTADIGFEAFGATPEEVFANSGRALFYLLTDLDTIQTPASVDVLVQGNSLPSLMVNWLSEILYLYDAEGWLFRNFVIDEFSESALSARAMGERFDRERHEMKLLVKAITYHQLAVEQTGHAWRSQVYVDI
jgi:SHS2 domain-containing protein